MRQVLPSPLPKISMEDITRQRYVGLIEVGWHLAVATELPYLQTSRHNPRRNARNTYHHPAINLRLLPSHNATERKVVTLDIAAPMADNIRVGGARRVVVARVVVDKK